MRYCDVSIAAEVARLDECAICGAPTCCMPGPRNHQGRPAPINGYELGYLIEQADRSMVICFVCLAQVLHAA